MAPSVRNWLLTGLLGLAGLAVLHLWVPSGDAAGAICLSRRVFHLPCPGCGMTRAFAHLAKLEWSAAWQDHPLSFALAVEGVLGWAMWGATLLPGRRFPSPPRVDTVLLANAAALAALWLGRTAAGTLPW